MPEIARGTWPGVQALAVVAALVTAAPADARSGPAAECLWQALPLATRDRAYVAYEDRGMESAGSIPTEAVMSAYAFCAGAVEAGDDVQAIGGYAGKLMAFAAVEQSSRTYLGSRGYSGAVLDKAWERLGPRQRVTLREGLPGMEDGSVQTRDVAKVVANAAKILGWTPARKPSVRFSHFTNYFVTRAAREALEERGIEDQAPETP